MSGEHVLCSDPLLHVVFEKIRRCGPDRADGQTIRVEGVEHGVTAHSVCTLRLVHVVTEQLEGLALGYQRAMVVLEVNKNGYPGMDGAAHLMPALLNGLLIVDPIQPGRHQWHVLPVVDVPQIFASGDDETGDTSANLNAAAYNKSHNENTHND